MKKPIFNGKGTMGKRNRQRLLKRKQIRGFMKRLWQKIKDFFSWNPMIG